VLTTTSLTTGPDIYGVANNCQWSNDVYTRNPSIAESAEGAYYENAGSSGPYVSDVVKPATAVGNWVAVTSGYEIEHLFSRYCDTEGGRMSYYYYMLNRSSVESASAAVPHARHAKLGRGSDFVDFMKIGNSVMRQGPRRLLRRRQDGRVQVSIFDVAVARYGTSPTRVPGRRARAAMGRHRRCGQQVARGVYFVRSSVQKDAGRIVVIRN